MGKLLSHKPEHGLKEFTLRSGASVYVPEDAISIVPGEMLVFRGRITSYINRDSDNLVASFLRDNTVADLIQEVQDWSGSWSIMIISDRGSVTCFTDPMGMEQLYYNRHGEFADDILSLRHSEYSIDELYKSTVSKWGYNIDDRTPWNEIKRVSPNHLYTFMGSEPTFVDIKPYYRFEAPHREAFILSLVREAVEEELIHLPKGTKSIGILLSGGIDSSIISYTLLGLKRGDWLPSLDNIDFHFYTINNAEDTPFVNLFAERFNIKVMRLSYDMWNTDLNAALMINEVPVDLGSMVPNQKMFQLVQDEVIFTGDGADELFGGYRRIDDYDSQKSDVFHELRYYHIPRLKKAARYYGKDLRCPFLNLNIVKAALALPLSERTHKKCLKTAFRGSIPDEILDRQKLPLKNDKLRENPTEYRKELIHTYYQNPLIF